MHVAKTTGFFQVGLVYTFVEFPNDTFLRQALCTSLRTINRDELTNEISFLDANCDLEIYNQILDNRGLAIDQLLTVVTFSNVFNSREHYQNKTRPKEPAIPKEEPISDPFLQLMFELS